MSPEQKRDALEAKEAHHRIELEEERVRQESLLEGGGSVRVFVWSVGDPRDGQWDCEGTPHPDNVSGLDIDGTWAVSTYEDDADMEHFELTAGTVTLRFSPWSDRAQRMLIGLSERFGTKLMGDLTTGEDQRICLSVYLGNT